MELNIVNYNPQKEKFPRKGATVLGRKRVVFEPGRNLISDESLASVESLPDFVKGLRTGVFEIKSKVSPKTPEQRSSEGLMMGDKLTNLLAVNATEAKAMASQETDPVVLERWLNAELEKQPQRKTVVFELEKQFKAVKGEE